MADERKEERRRRQTPPKGRKSDIRPPTAYTFVIWMMIILSIPLGIYYFRDRLDHDAQQLKQSEFEAALLDRRIDHVVVEIESATGTVVATGDYLPKAGATARKFTAEVMLTDDLVQMIRDNCTDWKPKHRNNVVGSLLFSLLPILLLIVLIYFLFARQIRSAGKGALQFGKSRARMNQNLATVTFNDIAGIAEAQEEVEEVIEYLKNPDKFHRLGGRIPKGVLMVGPPGTGKTLLARAIAGEADVPFFNISGSDFVEMFVGVGASRVRDMFEQGKKHAPCIIFIDEIDAVGRSRFSGLGGGHDEREQTLNALLVEMDGFEAQTGVIVMAATNRPDVLDHALLRPGRFDRQIVIDLPDLEGREGILKVHAKKVKISDQVDLRVVARGTPGFSGADLANLINEAALLAAKNDQAAIEMGDLEEARDKVRFGKERRSRKISDHDRRVTAFHEAGHALTALHCTHATPLHKVTIIPRGTAFLGATMHLPEHDRYTQTRAELIDELTVLMGGRFAEKLVFGEITSGAAADIKQASGIARKMVCEWGMSEKMGMISYGAREEHIYLGRDLTRTDDYSEGTARELDLEIKLLIDSVSARAERILSDSRKQLDTLGKALLERETMDVAEVRGIVGMPEPVDDRD